MRQVIISLAAMFASLALFVAGSALLGTVLALQLARQGYSASAVGLVLVCQSIGFVVGSRYAMHLIRRVGQVRSFAAFAAIGCVVALLHPMFMNGWLWGGLRGLFGFCAAGLIMVLESWISGRATSGTRGSLLAIYQVVYFFAAAFGQYLVAFGAGYDFHVYSGVAILIVLSLVPLALTRSEAPVIGNYGRLGFVELYALSPSGLFGGVAAGVVVSAFLSLAPVYIIRTGHAATAVSHYMSFAVLATMFLQYPLGRLSDVVDRRWLIAGLTVIAFAGTLVAVALGAGSLTVLYYATIPVFGLAGCIYPICLAMINDRMNAGDPVAASAGLLLVYGLGTCVGPVGAALAMQIVGPWGLFGFIAAVFALYGLFVFWRGFTTPELPVRFQGHYVNIQPTQAGPTILELDPRSDPYDAALLKDPTPQGSESTPSTP